MKDGAIATETIYGARILLGMILLLWSLVIGPDPELSPGAIPTAAPASKSGERAKDRFKKPLFRERAAPSLDTRAFIASFKRQSQRELIPCLSAWKPSPGSVGIAADLERTGQLVNVHGVSAALPPCAVDAIGKMSFRPLASMLEKESISVAWRADW